MDQIITYETPHSYLKRILEHDDSEQFQIIIKTVDNLHKTTCNHQEPKRREEEIIINTTLNKSRVVSRKINDAYQVDPTINSFSINFPNQLKFQSPKERKEKIEEVLQTLIKSTTEQVEINKAENDLYSIINTILNGHEDKENCHESLIKNQEEAISLLNTEFHALSIEYLSGHFIDFIKSSTMKNIEESLIKDIIDEYITEHYKPEKKDASEVSSIFEKLCQEEEVGIVLHFLLSIDPSEYDECMIEYIYDNLDDDIIMKETSRIILILRRHFLKIIEKTNNKKKVKKNAKYQKGEFKNIEYSGNELSGIIDYLQKQNGPGVGSNDILRISGGGFPDPSCPITNLIKYNSNNMNNECYCNYCNRQNPSLNDGWIEFDFGSRAINLTSYTIRARHCFCPKSWRIVGSNDHESWEVIDHRVNNSKLNGKYKQHRFESTKSDNYYRYIRYIQEDQWTYGLFMDDCISLTRIEFFGSISPP